MAPLWAKEDDNAIMKAAAERSGPDWPKTIVLPVRGAITGTQARKRFHIINKRQKPIDDQLATPPPAQRKRRRTPIEDRAKAAGVPFEQTPPSKRAVVANGSPTAAAEARAAIQKVQKSRHLLVARAEARAAREKLFCETRDRLQDELAAESEMMARDDPIIKGLAETRALEIIANEARNDVSARAQLDFWRWLSDRQFKWRQMLAEKHKQREDQEREEQRQERRRQEEEKQRCNKEHLRHMKALADRAAAADVTPEEIVDIWKQHRSRKFGSDSYDMYMHVGCGESCFACMAVG